MKKAMLLLLLASSVFVQAQSLKEALFGGKLKNQSGTVIRKGDDLASKIDTTQQKTITDETATTEAKPITVDSTNSLATQTDSAVVSTTEQKEVTVSATDAAATELAGAATVAAAAPKSNNALIKAYMDSVAGTLQTEALSSKKVKRGSYYVLVSYAIDTVGQVDFTDVFLTPENAYLQQQIKDRLAVEAPRLAPVLNSTGAPRKVTKKYNFTLTKE